MVFYCCDSIRRLCKMNYIDCNVKGQAVVYLQNVYVKTNIPYDLRGYKYCIRCGIDTRIHPIIKSNDVNILIHIVIIKIIMCSTSIH